MSIKRGLFKPIIHSLPNRICPTTGLPSPITSFFNSPESKLISAISYQQPIAALSLTDMTSPDDMTMSTDSSTDLSMLFMVMVMDDSAAFPLGKNESLFKSYSNTFGASFGSSSGSMANSGSSMPNLVSPMPAPVQNVAQSVMPMPSLDYYSTSAPRASMTDMATTKQNPGDTSNNSSSDPDSNSLSTDSLNPDSLDIPLDVNLQPNLQPESQSQTSAIPTTDFSTSTQSLTLNVLDASLSETSICDSTWAAWLQMIDHYLNLIASLSVPIPASPVPTETDLIDPEFVDLNNSNIA